MTDSTLTAAPAAPARPLPTSVAELAPLVPGFIQGARWFWWIAGLSAVNVACSLSHADFNFVLGLAYTQLVDAFFESHVAIGLAIDALFIGGFYLFGLKAQQGRTWAFVAGVLLYLGDALLWLKFAAWMPLAFHALALFYIGRAWVNLQAARKATGIR